MKLLGINIDHIATLRNVRNSPFPSLSRAVDVINRCQGIACITIHLREDRRHIIDADAKLLCLTSPIPINLEIACTDEMLNFAITHKPKSVCIVPEKREEMTTESGLDVIKNQERLAFAIKKLHNAGIKVSLFVDPVVSHITAAKEIDADIIEIHTGKYANATGSSQKQELERIKASACLIAKFNMECHAGHGLNYTNILAIAKIPEISLFNIGHFLICESVFIGLEKAINTMHKIINSIK